jgi:protein TonB
MEKDNSNKYLTAGVALFLFAMVIFFYPTITKYLMPDDGEEFHSEQVQESENNDNTIEADYNYPPPPPDYSSSDTGVEDDIFDVVEVEPYFMGGEKAMQDFIKSKVRYPEMAIQMGDQGKVYVRFVVEKSGAITNVSIARGLTPELDQEAMRVIQMMPNWEPGKQRGKPVRTRVVIPIVFKLV